MGEIVGRIKSYFRFEKSEASQILIIAVVYGLLFAFKDFEKGGYVRSFALDNFFVMFMICLLALLVHISVQKIYGLRHGYTVKFHIWKFGLVLSFLLAFYTSTFIIFLGMGGIIITHMKQLRLGKWRYGLNMLEHARISLSGPFANMVLAMIFKIMLPINEVLFTKIVLINIGFAIYNLLPIPPLDGSDIFFASRLTYAFAIGFVGGVCAILYLSLIVELSIIYAILVGVLFGAILWYVMGAKIDKSLW